MDSPVRVASMNHLVPVPLRTPGRCRRPLAQLCAGREPCANPAVMSPRGGRTPCWPSCWCRRSRQLTHGRQSGPV